MYDSEGGEAGKGADVAEAGAGPAAPCVGGGEVAGVEDEEDEGEPVGYSCCQGRAEEAHFHGVDEEVVEAGIEGGGDEEDVGTWAHDFCGGVNCG